MAIWYNAIPTIINEILCESPVSVLEIGQGGSLGVLLREINAGSLRIDCLIPHNGVPTQLQKLCYNELYFCDDIAGKVAVLEKYDVIVVNDCLREYDKNAIIEILQRLLKLSVKCVLFLCKQYPDDSGGNTNTANTLLPADLYHFDARVSRLTLGNNVLQVIKLFAHNAGVRSNPYDAWKYQQKADEESLNIAYIVSNPALTYNTRMLIRHMNALSQNGNNVTAYIISESMPEWGDVQFARECIPNIRHAAARLGECDVAVATWFEQLPFLEKVAKPVMLYEMGHDALFGTAFSQDTPAREREYFASCYNRRCGIIAASETIAAAIKSRYNRNCVVVPIGVDTFTSLHQPGDNTILIMGDPRIVNKGVDIALMTLQCLVNSGYNIKVLWATEARANMSGLSFPVEYVSVFDEGIYNRADIFLHTPKVDPHCNHVLEAFASGIAVVSTDCGISLMQNDVNCLICGNCDYTNLAAAVAALINDPIARQSLGNNAIDTAAAYSFQAIAEELQQCMHKLVTFNKIKLPK